MGVGGQQCVPTSSVVFAYACCQLFGPLPDRFSLCFEENAPLPPIHKPRSVKVPAIVVENWKTWCSFPGTAQGKLENDLNVMEN